jgi:nucleoside-diphosphate-sugar epimerase
VSLTAQQVLITGATGFLGGALALRLAQDGARVRALVRTPEKAGFLTEGIERFGGDVTDLDTMRRAAEGCSVVFHVAGAFADLRTQQAVNVEGTRNVATACGEARVDRLVHVSTIAVYGSGYRHDITEDMTLVPGAMPYAITKAEGERVLREVAHQFGLSYAIIRPGMIYGARGSLWTQTLYRLARINPTPWVGDGSGSAYPVYIDDVLDMLLTLAARPEAHGQAFNCTPDPSPTWREWIGLYSKLAGHTNWLAVPPALAHAAAGIAMLVSPPRSVGRDLPETISFLRSYLTFKMTKARDLLAWQPQVSLADGVQRCAPYLRETGLLR